MRILISLSYSPYDLVSFSWVPKIHFYLPKARLWRFSVQSMPLFNFGDTLVPHVQRQDENLTVDGFSWYTSEKSPAHNLRAIINKLSNQFFFIFNSYIILEHVHWIYLSLSLSLTLLCIYKYKNLVRWPFLKLVSLLELSSTFILILRNFL